MKSLIAASAVTMVVAFAGVAQAAKHVSKEDYGEQWPLTVNEAVVDCVRGSAAVVTVGGKTYQLNGTASSMGYPDVRPVWRDNPNIPGTKVSIYPLIKAAKTQC